MYPVSGHGHPAQPNFLIPREHCLTLRLLQAAPPVLHHLVCWCMPQQKHQHQVFQLRHLSCMQACMMHKHHFCWKCYWAGLFDNASAKPASKAIVLHNQGYEHAFQVTAPKGVPNGRCVRANGVYLSAVALSASGDAFPAAARTSS